MTDIDGEIRMPRIDEVLMRYIVDHALAQGDLAVPEIEGSDG